jgi:RNA polymerase sigma-70 factor (ECF subfamily)
MTSEFHNTRWTLVRRAVGGSEDGKAALSELCAAYYEPVVAFLRRSGREADAAREVAHEFFAAVLEKPAFAGAEPGRGRFRSYLLGALKHHLTHARERASRQKRGGGIEVIALDTGTDTSPGVDAADEQSLPPDREFDRQWALHVLHRATESLATEYPAAEFAALQPFIAGEDHGKLATLADSRGESAATLRKTVSRLRQRFRHHVKSHIAPTLDETTTPADELKALFEALSR